MAKFPQIRSNKLISIIKSYMLELLFCEEDHYVAVTNGAAIDIDSF